MTWRLDWLITRRMAARVLMVVFLFFCLILLSETLDKVRFERISEISGTGAAWLAVVTSAVRWAVKSLSVTVLIGAIIALLEFQSNREFVVMKVSGMSVWRIMVGPVLFVALFGLVVAFLFDGVSTRINREINPTPPGLGGGVARSTSEIWFKQTGDDGAYFIVAESSRKQGTLLRKVIVFPANMGEVRRIEANRAEFSRNQWRFFNVKLTNMDGSVVQRNNYRLKTDASSADLRLTVGSTEDFTYGELLEVLEKGLNDPIVEAAAKTRLFKLTSLPLLLVGSLLIAFAFTAGYRRDNAYGTAIIYGIVMGFVVFVITEMADRAGSSGVLAPELATWGPAVVSVLIGISVLLRKEDGRV